MGQHSQGQAIHGFGGLNLNVLVQKFDVVIETLEYLRHSIETMEGSRYSSRELRSIALDIIIDALGGSS